MGKIVLIAIIIGVGYAWQKGGLKEWYDESISRQRESLRQGASTGPQQHDPGPQFQPPSIASSPVQAAGSNAEACARARSNIQQVEQWMSSGGKVVEVGPKKALSENETFSALAEQRRFLEQNCSGR